MKETRWQGQRSSRQSRSFERVKRRRRVLGWIAGGLAAAAWSFSLSVLSYLPALEITEVNVYGVAPAAAASAEAAARDVLRGSYLGLFSRANTLIYPKKVVARAVTAASPELGAIDIRRNGLRGLAISAAEKLSAAVVCTRLPEFNDDGTLYVSDAGCYLADENGLLFKEASSSVPSGYITRIFAPDLPDDRPIGREATSSAAFRRLKSFMAGARAAGIEPLGLLIGQSGEYELYAAMRYPRNPSKSPGVTVIYFDEKGDPGTEFGDLVSFWKEYSKLMASGSETAGLGEIRLQYARSGSVYYTQEK